MTSGGFIKLHRKLTEWEWYSDPCTKDVFLHLLLTANHKTRREKGVTYKRGQAVFGRREMALKLGISERNVRTALNHLKSTNEITIKATKRGSVATIVNYEKYQVTDTGSVQQSDQGNDQKVTNNRPTSDQQVPTNKNDKNEKNEKNIKRGRAFDPEPLLMEKGFGPKIEEAIREWWRYKSERKEAYKETGWKKLLSQFQNKINVYGEQALVEALDRAISSGWKGWDFQSSFAKLAQEGPGEHYEEF